MENKREEPLGMASLSKGIADIFAEESENDQTFYGFSDTDVGDFCDLKGSDSDDGEVKKSLPLKKPSSQAFTLRVALRPRAVPPPNFDDEDEDEEEEQEEAAKPVRRGKQKPKSSKPSTPKLPKPAKPRRSVRFKQEPQQDEDEEKENNKKKEDEETGKPVVQQPKSPKSSDSESDSESSNFLEKRDMNIKANKAMLAQLMADLQKMPVGLLKAKPSRKKEPRTRAPRSSTDGPESPRRNPERTSRRHTRSMGGADLAGTEEHLELSLEEELTKVRGTPRPRAAPRPRQSKAHVVRTVEEITEDDLELVADNMTEKIYNTVTGSTCHQCRQKTVDTKTCCRNEDCRGIMGQFCGPCLRNRYGEDVRKALLDPEWRCPPCRGICNCSFCRQRDGRCPTGILFPLAQYHGFSDVHSYLTSLRNKIKAGDASADEE
ncbi:cell division cycle-associated protein 7-like isoform X2 [Engraulis encrasicolus]|uniref:cell division cycle-associated protein 7-like isoform X2 n=1 Tax=Engraulis encrasicolus TaxID=184585 RepID=UPI002FD14846